MSIFLHCAFESYDLIHFMINNSKISLAIHNLNPNLITLFFSIKSVYLGNKHQSPNLV